MFNFSLFYGAFHQFLYIAEHKKGYVCTDIPHRLLGLWRQCGRQDEVTGVGWMGTLASSCSWGQQDAQVNMICWVMSLGRWDTARSGFELTSSSLACLCPEWAPISIRKVFPTLRWCVNQQPCCACVILSFQTAYDIIAVNGSLYIYIPVSTPTKPVFPLPSYYNLLTSLNSNNRHIKHLKIHLTSQ